MRVFSVAAETYISLAVTPDGEVYGWGRGVNESDGFDDNDDEEEEEDKEVM